MTYLPVYTRVHLNDTRCEEKLKKLQKIQEPRRNLSVSPVMDSYGLHVYGTIVVVIIDYKKSVVIRYTCTHPHTCTFCVSSFMS